MDNQQTISKKKPLLMIFCLLVIIIAGCIVMAVVMSTEKSDTPLSYIKHGVGDEQRTSSIKATGVNLSAVSNNESVAEVMFLPNNVTARQPVWMYRWGVGESGINYSQSRFNMEIGKKYRFDGVDYNNLKSILVYHHVKYGLNIVFDCEDSGISYINYVTGRGYGGGGYEEVVQTCTPLMLDNFFQKWDKFYPDNRPIRMTIGQMEKPVVVPTPEPTPAPMDYDHWYEEITFNQRPVEEQAFHRIYPANSYGWQGE